VCAEVGGLTEWVKISGSLLDDRDNVTDLARAHSCCIRIRVHDVLIEGGECLTVHRGRITEWMKIFGSLLDDRDNVTDLAKAHSCCIHIRVYDVLIEGGECLAVHRGRITCCHIVLFENRSRSRTLTLHFQKHLNSYSFQFSHFDKKIFDRKLAPDRV
jgi:hypothetical protein